MSTSWCEVVRLAQAMHTAMVQAKMLLTPPLFNQEISWTAICFRNTVKTFDSEDPPSAVSRKNVVAVKEPTAIDLIEKDFMGRGGGG